MPEKESVVSGARRTCSEAKGERDLGEGACEAEGGVDGAVREGREGRVHACVIACSKEGV